MPDPIDTPEIPEMVARVRDTIAEVLGPFIDPGRFSTMDELTTECTIAVLETIREPTADMRWKGQDVVAGDLRFVSPQDIYQAMINAALGR